MKVIYEFDPDEDKDALHCVQNASSYYSIIWDIAESLRQFKKYHLDDTAPEEKRWEQYNLLLETLENHLDHWGE